MSTERETGYSFPSISPTSHPLVAKYTIELVKGVKVTVEFGLTTSYGRTTSPVPSPPGGGEVSILVAGMKASTTYHVRARIQWPDGRWLDTPDLTFTTGALPNIALPTLVASTSANQRPNPGVELINTSGTAVEVDLLCRLDAHSGDGAALLAIFGECDLENVIDRWGDRRRARACSSTTA